MRVGAGDATLEITTDRNRPAHYMACRAYAGVAPGSAAHATQATDDAYARRLRDGRRARPRCRVDSVAAFVGSIGTGPVGQAMQVTSVDDLTSSFTAAASASPVGVAVTQFFANGGALVGGRYRERVGERRSGTSGAKTGLHALDSASGWSLLVPRPRLHVAR